MEMYLLSRIGETFSNLESILLTGDSGEKRTIRNLQAIKYNFIGDAVFLETSDTLPTEQEVQEAQLEALQDLQLLKEYVKGQDFDGEVETVTIDGLGIVNEDESAFGVSDIETDGDSLVPEESDNKGVAVSLSLLASFLVLATAAFLVRKKRMSRGDLDDTGEQTKFAVALASENSADGDLTGKEQEQNVSYEAGTVATASCDSMNRSGTQFHPDFSSNALDSDSVLAPSQLHVNQIVALAPVQELTSETQFHEDLEGRGAGDGDSYGFQSFPGDGVEDSFVVSSPVGRADDYAGDDHDITVDLAEFADERPFNDSEDDDEW